MNLQDKVSTIMSKQVRTLLPEDKLQQVKDLIETFGIHHVPVVNEEGGQLVGIISKTDLLYFLKAVNNDNYNAYMNTIRLKNYTVGEAMSRNTVTIQASDTIKAALEILSENLFHAIPVLDDEELVGIVTTHDVIYKLLAESRVSTE